MFRGTKLLPLGQTFYFPDKLKDSKLLVEDSSIGVRHHILKSKALDLMTKSLGINGKYLFINAFVLLSQHYSTELCFTETCFYVTAECSIWESLSDNTKEKLVGLYGGKITDESPKVRHYVLLKMTIIFEQFCHQLLHYCHPVHYHLSSCPSPLSPSPS